MNRKVKSLMVLEGIRNIDIAKKAGVTNTWVSLIICGHRRSERVQRIIAKTLGERYEDLSPEGNKAA